MNQIEKAINILNHGGVIIFPTDTAFGIGCRIDRPEAVTRVLKIKQRPPGQATPVLIGSIQMAEKYFLHISEEMKNLMTKYWPGGLTIVGECRTELINSAIRGNRNTVGLRMPDNTQILQLINSINVPILGPSANFYKESTPYSFTELNPKIITQVDLVLDGVCKIKHTSTVVDCTVKPNIIIRQGVVKIV